MKTALRIQRVARRRKSNKPKRALSTIVALAVCCWCASRIWTDFRPPLVEQEKKQEKQNRSDGDGLQRIRPSSADQNVAMTEEIGPVSHPEHWADSDAEYDRQPDFGGLIVRALGPSFQRTIPSNEIELYNAFREELEQNSSKRELSILGKQEEDVNELVDNSSKARKELQHHYEYELGLGYDDDMKDGKVLSCRTPAAWSQQSNPVCNIVHEHSVSSAACATTSQRSINPEFVAVNMNSNGIMAYIWRLSRRNLENETLILKTIKIFDESSSMVAQLRKAQTDALFLDRLSISNRVIDLYGQCGLSVLTEYASGSLSSSLWPTEHRTKDDDFLDMLQSSLFKHHQLNNLTLSEQVDIALAMAESIAELHGFQVSTGAYLRMKMLCFDEPTALL